MLFTETRIYDSLSDVVMEQDEVLVAWEIGSKNENEIRIDQAFGVYETLEEARHKKFPEPVCFEVGKKVDFAWTGWFTEVEMINDLEGEELEFLLENLSESELDEVFA